MKLATWNVNSLKVRIDHLLGWLQQNAIDIVCLQETKLVDEKFPVEPLREAGYEAIFSGQPTYNGVAILYRRDLGLAPEDIVIDNPLLPDHQKRLITARFGRGRDGLRGGRRRRRRALLVEPRSGWRLQAPTREPLSARAADAWRHRRAPHAADLSAQINHHRRMITRLLQPPRRLVDPAGPDPRTQ